MHDHIHNQNGIIHMNARKLVAGMGAIALLSACSIGLATAANADETTEAAPVAPAQEVASSPSTEVEASTKTELTPTLGESTTESSVTTPPVPSASPEAAPVDVTSQPTEQKVSPSDVIAPTTTTSYVIALWEMLPSGEKFPQTLVASSVTSSTDVRALDAKATKCGMTYQSDLYANDRITNALIKAGILRGGDESWPGGSYQPSFSNVFTTAKCGPTVITVGPLAVTPPTCNTDGALPLTTWPGAQNPNGYEGDGFRVYLNKAYTGPGVYIATVQKVGPGFDPKYPLGTKVTGQLSQTLTVLAATGYQNTDPSAPCYVAPQEPKVEATVWVDGEYKCGDTTVAQTRTVTTTPYVFDAKAGTYTLDTEAASTVTEENVRELAADEVIECPVIVIPPTDVPTTDVPVVTDNTPVTPTQKVAAQDALAYTGASDTSAAYAVGAVGIFTLGILLMVLAVLIRRRRSAE